MFFSSSRAVGPAVGHFRIVQEEKNRVDVKKTNLCFLSVVKTKESAKSSSQPLLHFLFLYNSAVAYKGAMFFFWTAEMGAKQEQDSDRTKLIFIEHFF